MKEIAKGLYVSNQEDYENGNFDPEWWSFLLVAKEPFHRSAVGYTGRALDKNHPEYLMARRDNKLILNMVDAPKSFFFSKDLIDKGLRFIGEELRKGQKVGIVCNVGESRSATMALLWLVRTKAIDVKTLVDAEAEFLKLYPNYNPGAGIRDFIKENWDYYNTPF